MSDLKMTPRRAEILAGVRDRNVRTVPAGPVRRADGVLEDPDTIMDLGLGITSRVAATMQQLQRGGLVVLMTLPMERGHTVNRWQWQLTTAGREKLADWERKQVIA